ncbi:hypothetical protein [Streptomyces sp. NPDC050504]|uniref:hypothetical protein n=1 Tax=Streptomyces sp. NPDC050504 TaxID=3365618 RepID=UPI003798160E
MRRAALRGALRGRLTVYQLRRRESPVALAFDAGRGDDPFVDEVLCLGEPLLLPVEAGPAFAVE